MKHKLIILFLVISFAICGCSFVTRTNVDKKSQEIDKEIIEKMNATVKIIVKNWYGDYIKTIDEYDKIAKIINAFSKGVEVSDDVLTSEGNTYFLVMYDANDEIIYNISLWKSGYFGFNNEKEYGLSTSAKEILEIIG